MKSIQAFLLPAFEFITSKYLNNYSSSTKSFMKLRAEPEACQSALEQEEERDCCFSFWVPPCLLISPLCLAAVQTTAEGQIGRGLHPSLQRGLSIQSYKTQSKEKKQIFLPSDKKLMCLELKGEGLLGVV